MTGISPAPAISTATARATSCGATTAERSPPGTWTIAAIAGSSSPQLQTTGTSYRRPRAAAFTAGRALHELKGPGTQRSRLRLRLQPRIRIGTRARLAGRRHRGGARAGRFQHRLAVRLLAFEQVLNFVAGQRLEFQQAFCQSLEVGALLGQDTGGFVVALLDKTPDLGVDL